MNNNNEDYDDENDNNIDDRDNGDNGNNSDDRVSNRRKKRDMEREKNPFSAWTAENEWRPQNDEVVKNMNQGEKKTKKVVARWRPTFFLIKSFSNF